MNKLINISEGTSLAFHGLALIAKKAGSESPERVNVKIMAESLSASENHLSKVFQKLNKAGIVSSVRGPSGGFILEQPADEISFLQIYEILEGAAISKGCPMGRGKCSFHACIFEQKMHHISNQIYDILKNIRLSDFSTNK